MNCSLGYLRVESFTGKPEGCKINVVALGTSRSSDNASMKPGLVSGFVVAGSEQAGHRWPLRIALRRSSAGQQRKFARAGSPRQQVTCYWRQAD